MVSLEPKLSVMSRQQTTRNADIINIFGKEQGEAPCIYKISLFISFLEVGKSEH